MLPLSGTVVGDGVVAGSRRPGRWHHFGRGRGEPEKGGPPACRPGPDGAAPVPHVPTEPAPGSGAPDAVPPPGDVRSQAARPARMAKGTCGPAGNSVYGRA